MKEHWDIYDNRKNKTGIVKARGSELMDGEYHLVALVWIKGCHGKYLISKRSSEINGAGQWQTTGGCVLSGETSLEGAIREVKEEIGLNASADKMKLFQSKLVGDDSGWIADYWFLEDDIDIEKVICQEEEVAAVKWATFDEIEAMMRNNRFFYGELHLEELKKIEERGYYE